MACEADLWDRWYTADWHSTIVCWCRCLDCRIQYYYWGVVVDWMDITKVAVFLCTLYLQRKRNAFTIMLPTVLHSSQWLCFTIWYVLMKAETPNGHNMDNLLKEWMSQQFPQYWIEWSGGNPCPHIHSRQVHSPKYIFITDKHSKLILGTYVPSFCLRNLSWWCSLLFQQCLWIIRLYQE